MLRCMSFSPLSLLRPLGLAAFASAVVFAGCGGDDDADDDVTGDGGASSSGAATTSLQSACEALADEGCDRFTECVAGAFLDAQYDCKAGAVASCVAASNENANVQASDLDACRTQLKAATCTEVLTTSYTCKLPAGDLAEGKGCKDDTDCASSFCAKGTENCGTCAVPPAEGAACIQLGCGPDRVCQDGKTCVTPKKAGEGCTDADSCVGSLSCVNNVCAAPLETEGAACDPAGKTAPTCSLLKALYCGQETQKCLKLTPAAVNETCGFVDGQIVVCTISNFCKTGDGGLAGTCTAKIELGGACDPKAECKPGLSCKDGKCADPNTVTCP
jgi:hypothetical protein